jgi:pimeloyl-ACP methyl ester carboxylesterase
MAYKISYNKLYLCISCVSYFKIINESYQRLEVYNVKTFDTEYGTMSYVDEGFGEAVIISHGIFGGYDQGYQNLYSIYGENYRKIAISRFGYPGSNLPDEPTPSKQARVFLELLNELKIDKVFLIAASAGGASGIRFALDYPDRLKGLILLSSGVSSVPMTKKELGMSGPPKFILNDKLILFSIRNFKGIFYFMFGSKDDPMVKYENTEYFLKRVNAELMIFPDGGHLIIGHDITDGIINFVEKNSNE